MVWGRCSVNTPTKSKGLGAGMAADLTYWESAARGIASVSKGYKIIVEKSTVPVKTAEAVEKVLKTCAPADFSFDVLSNPEFLAEVRRTPCTVQRRVVVTCRGLL
jgi:UDPglucose 6-dehydrogenase